MLKLTKKHLLMLTGLLSLSGCATVRSVINPSPKPYYMSCETVQYLAKCDAPKSALQDGVGMTNVMDKLRAREPEDERDNFIRCQFDVPKCASKQSDMPKKLPGI